MNYFGREGFTQSIRYPGNQRVLQSFVWFHCLVEYHERSNCLSLECIGNTHHCGFSDAAGPGKAKCEIGEGLSCGGSAQGPTLTPAEQNGLTVAIVRPWLDHHLKGIPGALGAFQAAIADPRVSFTGP